MEKSFCESVQERNNIDYAMSLIKSIVPTLGKDVEFEYGIYNDLYGRKELEIKIKSPHLTYRQNQYASGGDSIFLGVKIKYEYKRIFTYYESGDFVLFRSGDVVGELLQWAVELGQGKKVDIQDKHSQMYVDSKGIL